MKRSSKVTTARKLEETSWLAQIIQDKMDVESDTNGHTRRWHNLHIFKIIVNAADDPENGTIYYDDYDGKRRIIICDIPSMIAKYGTDFSREGMRSKLLGLQASTTDDEGMYTVNLLITHDLNSATINDISDLLYRI